jgi:hypothetical protein
MPPLNQLEREESRLSIRGNPQNRICKEIAFQRPKTGKFDYLGVPSPMSRRCEPRRYHKSLLCAEWAETCRGDLRSDRLLWSCRSCAWCVGPRHGAVVVDLVEPGCEPISWPTQTAHMCQARRRGTELRGGDYFRDMSSGPLLARRLLAKPSLDEAIFTKACALQLNPPRHNKRPMGDGYHSC